MAGSPRGLLKGLKSLRPLDLLPPLLAIALLWPVVARYERPVQDRDFASLGGGSADFASYYLGSLALVRGFDPYLNGREEFRDPWHREIEVEGVTVGQYYLPGHYLVFAPLAWIYGERWEAAATTYFWIHVGLLMVLAWLVTCLLAGRIRVPESDADIGERLGLWALVSILLGLQFGVRLGLERGQSDALQSALLWGGVLAAAWGQMALAGFVLVIGTSMKGYGGVLLLGLVISCAGDGGFKKLLIGSLAGLVPLMAFTAPFAATGLRVALYQSADFSFHWMNHSFKHVGFALSPSVAEFVRYALSLLTLAATAALWWRYRTARTAGSENACSALILAATASIALMLGFSATSAPYNLVLVLPGLACIFELIRRRTIPISTMSEALFAAAFFLIALNRTTLKSFAPAAYGLMLLALWLAWQGRAGAAREPVGPGGVLSVTLLGDSQGD
jgi:hypothetical protein